MLKTPIYTPPKCNEVYTEWDAVLCTSSVNSDFNDLSFEQLDEE